MKRNIKEKKENIEIPKVEYQKSTKKELIWSIGLILAYFIPYVLEIFILEGSSKKLLIIIEILYYVGVLILSILCFKERLKKDIKLFKDNSKSYIKYIFPKIVQMYIIYFIFNFICVIITGQNTSVNQEGIKDMSLWSTIPLTIVWAPIVEELIFRGVLRRFIKNNTIFIITSGIIFGVLHTIGEASIFNILVLAIPYAIPGVFFAYLYAKTENITCNIFAHCFENTIATIFMIMTML